MSKLIIHHVLESADPRRGGVISAVADLCHAFVSAGHEVKLFLPHNRMSHGNPKIVDLPVIPLPKGLARPSWSNFLHKGPTDGALLDCDILHLHSPWAWQNVPISKFAVRKSIPYVLTIHGMLDRWALSQKPYKKRLYLRTFARPLLENAAALHFTAEEESTQGKEALKGMNVNGVIIPLVFDASEYLAIARQPPKKNKLPTILFLSRLHPQKGCEILLQSAAMLRDRGERFKLIIAGSGGRKYELKLKTMVSAYDLNNQVEFAGLVVGAEKLSKFRDADIFVLPTFQESFGISIVEAMAAGVPVVTTREVDIWRELEHGGVRFARCDAASLAEQITLLLRDTGLRTQISESGRQLVNTWLSVGTVTDKYLTTYHRCISQRKLIATNHPENRLR